MGTCSVKNAEKESFKVFLEIPFKKSFTDCYVPGNEIYMRSEQINTFKAYDRTLNFPVLVKQISQVVDPATVMYEVSLMQQCDHPYIIKLINYFQTDAHYFLIYQFHEGTNILDYFAKKNTPTTIDELKQIFRQSILALNYLHSRNIVHGKLDITNLYYDQETLSIAGFGNAKIITDLKSKKSEAFQSPLAVGFQAPEVIDGQLGFGTDVWSLGVVFYCLVSADMPFKGDNRSELQKLIKSKSINTALLVKKGAPDVLIDLIQSMLTKDVSKRLSGEKLLKHPFFDTVKINSTKLLLSSFNEMKSFVKMNKLSQKFYLSITDLLMTSHDKALIADSFLKFDVDNDGVISYGEFIDAIRYAGLLFQENEAKEIFKQIDQNSTGSIEYSEFLAVFVKVKKDQFSRKLKALFDELDVNNDNMVSMRDFTGFLGQRDELAYEIEEVSKLVNSENRISFDHFSSLVNERLKMN